MRTEKNRNIWKDIGTILILVTIVSCLATVGMAKEESNMNIEEMALKKIAEKNGLTVDKLVIENQATINVNNQKVYRFKITDKNEKFYGIDLDVNGNYVDVDKLLTADRSSYEKKNGKLSIDLAKNLETVTESQDVSIIVWLKEFNDNDESDDRTKIPAINSKETLSKIDDKRKKKVEKVVSPFVEKLKKKGYNIEFSDSAPVIYAKLKPSQIREISKMPEVDMVYEDNINTPSLDVARSTIHANTVYNRNFAGWGHMVGEIEVGGAINSANPYLASPNIFWDTINTCQDDHAAAVAGVMRSWHQTFFGISPGIWLRIGGSCGGTASELQQAESRAADWGAYTLTNSWGSKTGGLLLNANDRFLDDMVYNRYRTVIVSAGNRGGIDNDVTSPALAYNVISVGNFDDRNTVVWGDDIMEPGSSFDNPLSLHSDREKPEVAAPGTNIDTTVNNPPWHQCCWTGTSFSAPMVAGEISQMIDRNFWMLWPEEAKVIIMVTATHNIEGNARLSGRDGAGGIVNDLADNVVSGGRFGTKYYTCSQPTLVTLASPYLYAGQRVRIAIAWSTNPGDSQYYGTNSNPSADLDLQVYRGTTQVVSSSSYDNTYEIVDFTPTISGTHDIKVKKYGCRSVKYLGWAWNVG